MTSRTATWKSDVQAAAAAAAGRVIGLERIEHFWHARLVEMALLAFGQDDRARFYIETLAPSGRVPRPDLIICHPAIGCMIIENKGVSLEQIRGVEGTTLLLHRDGRDKREDPFAQAEKVELRLKDLLTKRLKRGRPLFSSAVAVPRVEREAFERAFTQRWPIQTLFTEALASPATFRQQVLRIVSQVSERAGRKVRWFANGAEELHRIITGEIFVAPARPSRLEDQGALDRVPPGEEPLGLLIERISLADHHPTAQQHEIARRNFRGAHWLFRGVAGSGKSVMLALSAAQTLYELTVQDNEEGLFAPATTPGLPPRVLVCCYNKSLLPFLRGRIEERYQRLAYDFPPRDSLQVVNIDRLAWDLERTDPALGTGLPMEERDARAAKLAELFDALPTERQRELQYEAIYLDEAQDLHPAQIRLLRRLARPDRQGGQTLVIFYDNAQNIYGVPQPVWDELGVKIVGRTSFLDRCLRNTRETLELAFNVLVGSHAPEGQRVTTRRFADVASLRERNLVEETAGAFVVKFAHRDQGPAPEIRLYRDRASEAEGVAEYVRHLVVEQQVLPSDILLLARSHQDYPNLERRLRTALGPNASVRMVNRQNDANKRLPLIEDGVLTVSTIASAKGYDAAVVVLMGCDRIDSDTGGRASFYVGATRAKYQLVLTAVEEGGPSGGRAAAEDAARLLPEILDTAAAMGVVPIRQPPPAPPQPAAIPRAPKPACRHCRSTSLHAQHGPHGYYLRCIDCMKDTPMPTACPICGERGRVTKRGYDFLNLCSSCGGESLVHRNVPLM